MTAIMAYGPAERAVLGRFEVGSQWYCAERVGDAVLVSCEQEPAGMRTAVLSLAVDGAEVVAARWYAAWAGAPVEARAAILDPTMALLRGGASRDLS